MNYSKTTGKKITIRCKICNKKKAVHIKTGICLKCSEKKLLTFKDMDKDEVLV
jgi:hypothetical protein